MLGLNLTRERTTTRWLGCFKVTNSATRSPHWSRTMNSTNSLFTYWTQHIGTHMGRTCSENGVTVHVTLKSHSIRWSAPQIQQRLWDRLRCLNHRRARRWCWRLQRKTLSEFRAESVNTLRIHNLQYKRWTKDSPRWRILIIKGHRDQ